MKRAVRFLVFVFAGLTAEQVLAQNVASETPESDDQSVAEVLVRGRKPLNDTHTVNVGAFGSKDVLDIPISIQTYSSALIENLRARTINDVLRNDSSIQNAAVGG